MSLQAGKSYNERDINKFRGAAMEAMAKRPHTGLIFLLYGSHQ